jgi:hypothetical protein
MPVKRCVDASGQCGKVKKCIRVYVDVSVMMLGPLRPYPCTLRLGNRSTVAFTSIYLLKEAPINCEMDKGK